MVFLHQAMSASCRPGAIPNIAGREPNQKRIGAFWTLFMHIKKNDIAMTAPVEMTYEQCAEHQLEQVDMSFLYRNTDQGKPGMDGSVKIADVPAITVISIGMRGATTKARSTSQTISNAGWLTMLATTAPRAIFAY